MHGYWSVSGQCPDNIQYPDNIGYYLDTFVYVTLCYMELDSIIFHSTPLSGVDCIRILPAVPLRTSVRAPKVSGYSDGLTPCVVVSRVKLKVKSNVS